MPLYSSRCQECGSSHTYVRKVAERNDTPLCCGVQTAKTLDTPMVSAMAWTGHKGVFMPDGQNGGKGTFIESGADYHKYLRDNNKIPASEGAREAEIQKGNREAEHDKVRREAVIAAVQQHCN
jgi:predicted nucleic acid-binding Zn ribbon protein